MIENETQLIFKGHKREKVRKELKQLLDNTAYFSEFLEWHEFY